MVVTGAPGPCGGPLARTSADEPRRERITDREKGESTGKKIARFPLRVATLPLWVLDRGLYHGMILVDEKKLIPRAVFVQRRLAELGIAPQIGGAGDGAGFGGGVAWSFYRGPVRPTLSVSGSVKGYQDHGFELDFSEIFDDKLDVVAGVRYRSRPQEDFFGLGPESREQNRTSYNLEQTLASLDVEAAVAGAVTVAGQVELSNNNVSGGRDEAFPSTERVFSAAAVPGLGTGAELVTADLSFVLDGRDYPGDATSGGLIQVFAGVGEDTGGAAFDYWHYGAEARGFLALLGRGNRFGPRSVLALRVRGDFNQPRNGGTVPFFRMPHVGGSSSLRGFREFRFYDRHAVVANFEYRWRIQALLEAVLFLDEGQVFDRIGDLELGSFRESYGGGIRVAFRHNTFFRVEIGRSSEDTRLLTKFNVGF